VAFALQLPPDLADPVDAEVGVEDPLDLGLEPLVADRPIRRRPGTCGVVGARSDRGARLGEGTADRLDSELLSMLVDVADQRCCGRSSSTRRKPTRS
jgi:hypothetical protein